jgi:hypothetical protein
VIPDLAALDLPGLVTRAGDPGTRVISATSWLLSLLTLKLTRTRRVSHADDLLADPAGLLAGLGTLPKKSALTSYSYRLSHDHQRNFLAALDAQMSSSGLASGEQAIFDLDFQAVMHWAPTRCWTSTTCPNDPSGPAACSPSSPKTPAPTTSSTPTPTWTRPPRPARCSPPATIEGRQRR